MMASAKKAMNEFEAAASLMPGRQDVEVDNRATRYLFFAGDEPGMMAPGGMSVNTACVPNKMIFRGQVTPCVSTPIWTRKEEIPEGQMLMGSEEAANAPKGAGKGKAAYLSYAGLEAKNLLMQYGHDSDYTAQWGLVELKALRGKSLEEVQALRVTSRYFPKYPAIPETNFGMIEQIESVMAQIKAGNDPNKDILLQCGEEMLTACEHAQAHQERLTADSNMRVTLAADDPGYKKEFDGRDRVYAKRSGVPLATNSLRGNQSDSVAQIARAVTDSVKPQGVDPQMIASIVAATVAALRETAPVVAEAAPVEDKKPAAKKVA